MTTTQRHLHLDLPHDYDSPLRARRAVRGLVGDDGDAYVDDALLLTSELVTNAIEHTPGGCTLTATMDPFASGLRVEVSDGSAALPVLSLARRDAISGRGLRIVDLISRRWGAETSRTGKTVWFELGR